MDLGAEEPPVLSTPALKAELEAALPAILERSLERTRCFVATEAGELILEVTKAVTDAVGGMSAAHKAIVTCTVFGTEAGAAVGSASVMLGDASSDSAVAATCRTDQVGCIVNVFLCCV